MRRPGSLSFNQHNKGLNTRNPGIFIANNKGADQLAIMRSPISTFVTGYLKSKVIGWISLNSPFYFDGLQHDKSAVLTWSGEWDKVMIKYTSTK